VKRLCPHADKEWRCTTCCIAELRRNHTRLTAAVSVRNKTGNDGPRPAFGSREPINVSALALLQDLGQHGGTDGLEAKLATTRDPNALRDLQRQVRQYRSRSALILHDALAPYPMLWPVEETVTDKATGEQKQVWKDRPIPCPVIDEDGPCGGDLMVHRDDDPASPNFGKAAVIVCRSDDEHEWTLAHGGWLRLGVLLGGEVGAA
jgi:hypothetical protein